MTPERWEEIKEMAQKNFEVLANINEDIPAIKDGKVESLVFIGPLGKIKLEMVIKPLVLEKRTHYSKRAGQETKVDYITSDTEKVRTLSAYRWEEASDSWEKINSSQFA